MCYSHELVTCTQTVTTFLNNIFKKTFIKNVISRAYILYTIYYITIVTIITSIIYVVSKVLYNTRFLFSPIYTQKVGNSGISGNSLCSGCFLLVALFPTLPNYLGTVIL